MSASDHLGPQFPIAEYALDPDRFPGWRRLVAYSKGAPPDPVHDLAEHEVGHLTYLPGRGRYEVGDRRTHEDYQRQGVATQLQDALQKRAGRRYIVSTDDGISQDAVDFHRAYKDTHPDSTWSLAIDRKTRR